MPHSIIGSLSSRYSRGILPLLFLGALGALSCVSSPSQANVASRSGTVPQRSPRDWAVLASNNEVLAIDHAGSFLRYRVHTVDAKGDRLRDIVECTGGSVSRLLAVDGKPLSSEQDAAERKRLEALAQDPGNFAHHSEDDAKAKKLARDLVRLMPDAMTYTPVPGENGRAPDGSPTLAFDFSPNPLWHAPSTISEALTGLRGRIWFDTRSGFVQQMHGEVFRPVNFGYGMVAHIFPGGHLEFEQTDIGRNRWIYSHFAENLRIRALMLKTIDLNTTVDASDFHQLPAPLTYQQAIALLLS